MGGIDTNIWGFWYGFRLRWSGETPWAVVVENNGSETTEGDVRRCFGGSKIMAKGIRKVWWGGEWEYVVESESGTKEFCYAGREKGDARVVKWFI